MHVKNHFLLGILLAVFLWLIQRTDPKDLIILVQSTVLIDLDHFISYVATGKTFRLKRYLEEQHHYLRIKKQRFYMLHKIEVPILLFLLSIFMPVFLYVFIGFAFHLLLDIIVYILHHRSLYHIQSYSYLHDIYCGIRGVPAY
jgi:hypothetical protein